MTSLFRRAIGAGALALALAAPAYAAEPAAAPAPAPAAKPATVDADPALWVVKDEDTTIYLFGTVHVLKPGLGWFDEAVKDAFDKSDSLMLEMVEPDEATMVNLVTKLAVDDQGRTVRSKMNEEQNAAYAKAMQSLGIPVDTFDKYDPWFTAVNLTMISIMKAGYDPKSGAETALTQAAKAANKPIAGFETAEEQLGFFDNLPQEAQVKFLTETAKSLPETDAMMTKMVDSWGKGDSDGLAKLINEGMEDKTLYKVLLTDRNARWAQKIKARMDQPGTVFVAVGAGHLAGAGSVQEDLTKLGLKVERVDY